MLSMAEVERNPWEDHHVPTDEQLDRIQDSGKNARKAQTSSEASPSASKQQAAPANSTISTLSRSAVVAQETHPVAVAPQGKSTESKDYEKIIKEVKAMVPTLEKAFEQKEGALKSRCLGMFIT